MVMNVLVCHTLLNQGRGAGAALVVNLEVFEPSSLSNWAEHPVAEVAIIEFPALRCDE